MPPLFWEGWTPSHTTSITASATARPAGPTGPAAKTPPTTPASSTTTTAVFAIFSHSLYTSPSGNAYLHQSRPPTQELSSRAWYEATPGLAPPQRAEFDDLAAQVSELSLSYGQETVGIKRNIEQIKLDMATMASGIEPLRKNDRDKEEQQADILRLQSMVTQLRDENAQLLEEQRYSGTAGQLARFTLSLPSVITPIRSSSPIVGVSRDGFDGSLSPCPRWTRGGNLRSTSQCRPPDWLWWVVFFIIFNLYFFNISLDPSFPTSPLDEVVGFVKTVTADTHNRWRWSDWRNHWW